MTLEELNFKYLDWMYDLVCDDQYSRGLGYRKLFGYLYNVEFTYTLPMDGNRFEDGINLRYKFGMAEGYDDAIIATYLDVRPCSVLEMMIALALRCEVHIMDDSQKGNRVGQWFWEMVVNLGISMPDDKFDPDVADRAMDIFLNRKYDRDGRGGLFRTNDLTKNMRTMDIWYQMCAHLNDVYEWEI